MCHTQLLPHGSHRLRHSAWVTGNDVFRQAFTTFAAPQYENQLSPRDVRHTPSSREREPMPMQTRHLPVDMLLSLDHTIVSVVVTPMPVYKFD